MDAEYEDFVVVCVPVQCSVLSAANMSDGCAMMRNSFIRKQMTNERSIRELPDPREKLVDTRMMLRERRVLCACVILCALSVGVKYALTMWSARGRMQT